MAQPIWRGRRRPDGVDLADKAEDCQPWVDENDGKLTRGDSLPVLPFRELDSSEEMGGRRTTGERRYDGGGRGTRTHKVWMRSGTAVVRAGSWVKVG